MASIGHGWRRLAVLLACLLAITAVDAQVVRKTGTTPARGGFGTLNRGNNTLGNTNTTNNNTYPSDSNYTDTSATKGLVYVTETPDSVLRRKVFFFYRVPHSVKIDEVWNPTLDPTGVQFSDPLDGFNGNYYLGQGTIGHPHLPVFPTVAEGLGHSLQYEGQDGYLKTPGSIRLYQTLTPYTLLSYNNTLNKDYLVHVAHTQNIIPGWNVSFDYQLICPEGNLSGSGAKNHYLDATTNYFSSDSRLQVQAGFIWQSLTMDENGGLSDDSYFTDNQTSNLGGLPVMLYNSASKNLHHNAFIHATYNMVQQVEKYRHRDSLAVRHDTVSVDSIRMVVDTLEVVDTIPVGKPHIINAGVFGVEMDYSRWKRAAYLTAFSDSLLWSDASASLFWTNDAYPDHRWRNPLKITLGITPRRLDAIITTDTTAGPDTLVSSAAVNPFAKVEIALGQRITLKAEAELDNTALGLHDNLKEPDYHAAATMHFQFDSAGNSGMELVAAMQRQLPDIRMLHATNYTLDAIQTQRYGMHFFHHSDSGLFRLIDLSASMSHLSHNLRYDSTLTVNVGDGDFFLYQAALSLNLQWGWFHVDMQQLLQHSTDRLQMDVPTWASKNSIYADFNLFHRALRMQVGVDIRYYTLFAPDAYAPATGLFYMQDTETGDYLWGDAFINLQVKRASIYVKAGHINALWESSPRYFLLPHYPGNRFGLFWGLTWNFFD
ncbi:MAG: hypothetical protein IJ634_05740 [Bacteroidales bacterium]|nr:hypothetical protein [Bacteroidales bacterium]